MKDDESVMKPRMMRIMLHVKDVLAVAAFYQETLGCSPVGALSPDWAELDAGGCAIALHKWKTAQAESGKSWSKIVFGVEDVEAVHRALSRKGVKVGTLIQVDEPPYEGLQFFDGKDPEGNTFQISNRGVTSCLPE